MVPEGWRDGRVGDLLERLESGVSVNGEDRPLKQGEFGVLRVSSVTYGTFMPSAAKAIIPKDIARAKCHPRAGQIIISRSNTDEHVGASAFIEKDHPNLYLSDKLWQTVPKPDANMRWLSYMLSSEHTRYLLSNLATGTSGSMKNITKDELLSLKTSIPPLPEQKKIAEVLSTWDQAITATECLLENSLQRKRGLMQQLLTGKKRLVNVGGIPLHGDFKPSKSPYRHLPSDWAEVALSNISSFITKGATPTTYGFEWQDSGIPFIRSECVGENGFRASGLAHICREAHEVMGRSKVFNGDILITITGNVGRVCMLPERFEEANINQHIAKITLDEAAVDREFVFQCLQDRKYRVQFERITTGQAYPQISLVQVRDTIIPMPPLHEQRKIALVLSIADQEISALKLRLSALIHEKHALMQPLLTGKRRVQVETEAA